MAAVPTGGFPPGVVGYQSLGFLGQGASGQVFKARQRSTGQFVAIKIPSAPVARDPAARRRVHQRLHQETRLLAMFQHTHVVRLIDKGMARDDLPFAVLEYVPGHTLREYLQRHGRLSLHETMGLMIQVLDALAFLHIHQVVHRDLKPENVMVVRTETALHAKLLDFGLASHHGAHAARGGDGTPAYCAPEQLRGEVCVAATDIYAWALIFIECLSARPCVQGESLEEVLACQMSEVDIALPVELEQSPMAALLRRALRKDVRQRAADSTQLYRELMQCLAQLHGASKTPKPAEPMPVHSAGFGAMPQPTLDTPHTSEQRAGPAAAALLSLSLRVCPEHNASVSLSVLQELLEQERRWCLQSAHMAEGRNAGTLGDSMVFRFERSDQGQRNLQQLVAWVLELRVHALRRSHMLQIQHGVRLEMSGGVHLAEISSPGDVAVNLALHLNSLAAPGAVLLSKAAQQVLAGRVPMQIHSAAQEGSDAVYRLTDS